MGTNQRKKEIIYPHFGWNNISFQRLWSKREDFQSPIHREERQGSSSQLSMNDLIWIDIWILAEHFGSHVFWTATVCSCQLISLESFLAEAEIGYFQVAVHVDHYVFWFYVSVYDVLFVKVLDSQKNLDKAVTSLIFCHSLHFSQVKEKFTSWAIFSNSSCCSQVIRMTHAIFNWL